jgi:hypothetical protein
LGSRGLWRRRAILSAVVVPAPTGVLARRRRISALPVRRALMTLRASPSWACPHVSRIRSLAGARPGLAGRSAVPPVCTDASGPCAPPSSHALPC